MKKDGLIIKGIDGFYYVRTAEGLVQCRARGLFRKNGVTPLAGDRVEIEVERGGATVTAVKPRKNFLVRPPVANIDRLVIVSSLVSPAPNALVIDRMTALANVKGIEAVLVFTKTDIAESADITNCYRKAGFPTVEASSVTGEGVSEVKKLIEGRVSTFAGNTGVGKSSLLNLIIPGLGLKTGEISQKLGRGRHTTREVELFELDCGGYVADTPGFSSFEISKSETILKENLAGAFQEFAPFIPKCRYYGCTHIGEKDCAVMRAVEDGIIPRSRYESYVSMYMEVKDLKEWNLKKDV